jgi:hypothetical protein
VENNYLFSLTDELYIFTYINSQKYYSSNLGYRVVPDEEHPDYANLISFTADEEKQCVTITLNRAIFQEEPITLSIELYDQNEEGQPTLTTFNVVVAGY